jgi:hypothetical protein
MDSDDCLIFIFPGWLIHQTIIMWTSHLLALFLDAKNVTRIQMESNIIPKMVIRRMESK